MQSLAVSDNIDLRGGGICFEFLIYHSTGGYHNKYHSLSSPVTYHHKTINILIILIQMPHSITGKHRSKRPDNRPNAKKRKKQREDEYAKAEAKDVISTRIPKKDQKERPVTGKSAL